MPEKKSGMMGGRHGCGKSGMGGKKLSTIQLEMDL
jgi:hypothetical protein